MSSETNKLLIDCLTYENNNIEQLAVCLSGKYQNINIRHTRTFYKHFKFTDDKEAQRQWSLNDDISERW